MTTDFSADPEARATPDFADDLPPRRGPSLILGLLGYLLLLVLILGGLAVGVVAILQPMILPAVRLLLQHH